jgi:hypothetical protein
MAAPWRKVWGVTFLEVRDGQVLRAEIVHRGEADVFSWAEGSIWQRPLFARSGRLAGVPSPGHAPQGWPRNRRELPISSSS